MAKPPDLLAVRFAHAVLADRDELHLGGHDTLPGVVHLGDVGARPGPARRVQVGEAQRLELRVALARPPVLGGNAVEELGVAALVDPPRAQREQAPADVDPRIRVRVRAGGVVDVDGVVSLHTLRRVRIGERDLPERHVQIGPATGPVHLPRAGKRLHRFRVDPGRLAEKLLGCCAHDGTSLGSAGKHRLPSARIRSQDGGRPIRDPRKLSNRLIVFNKQARASTGCRGMRVPGGPTGAGPGEPRPRRRARASIRVTGRARPAPDRSARSCWSAPGPAGTPTPRRSCP